MVQISVAGQATQGLAPERAQVVLRVSIEGDDRTAVLAQAVEAHQWLVAQVSAHRDAGAASWWGTEQVSAWPFKEYLKDSDVLVTKFRASASVQIRFADFGVLSAWLPSVSGLVGIEVQGIEWSLTEATKTRVQAAVRREAVLDAVERARHYATSLGLGEPRLEAVFEPGLRPHLSGVGGSGEAMFARSAHAMDAAGPGFVLAPGDVEVSASVTADFRCDPA